MKILYFASLREQLGVSEEIVTTPLSTIMQLLDALAERGDLWATLLRDNDRLQIAVNQSLARRNSPIQPDDEIAFFPPVTGG